MKTAQQSTVWKTTQQQTMWRTTAYCVEVMKAQQSKTSTTTAYRVESEHSLL